MLDQPRYDPLEESDFFEDGAASRSPVPGTVHRGDRRGDKAFVSGVRPEGGSRTDIKVFFFCYESRVRRDIVEGLRNAVSHP